MAQGDIFRVTANFSGPQGQLRQWVWHYIQESAGSPSLADVIDAVITILAAVWALIDAYIDTDSVGETLELALWDAGLQQFDTVIVDDIDTLVGDGDDLGSPGNVAPYITFFTSLARSRGKKFLFDIGRVNQVDGLLDGAMLANMILAGDQWNNAFNIDGVVFRPGNFNRPTEDFRSWQTNAVGVGAFTGSQYRRLPGRGA
jgi:hypothetical protein